MDEPWRMRTTMPTHPKYPSRRSTEDAAFLRRGNPISGDHLSAEDFSDVFGGPPRTILSRQFSAGSQRSQSSSTSFFYQEAFRQTEKAPTPPSGRIGRSLPELRIPSPQNNDFYSDIFGWEDHERVVRSRSRSKASSSSVLSSEELSPLRPAIYADGYDDVSCLGAKLRPINVRSGCTSRRMAHDEEDFQKQQNMMSPFALHNTEKIYPHDFKSYSFGLSRPNTSPASDSHEPLSKCSFEISTDELELNSPSSLVSCQSSNQDLKMDDEISDKDVTDEEDDEVMSSYVIEISSDNMKGTYESNGVDEAIAWAKEKYRTHCPESKQECRTKNPIEEVTNGHQVFYRGHTDSVGSLDEHHKYVAEEETKQFDYEVQTETQKLDEKIRLWSTGKEANIRLLLSSLHQILWPNSGWSIMPLSNLTEISQVKKAYQKACLCLHPDKLQQRGATLPQEYIAKKVFSVLQDAWTSFVAQGVL